jgi:hypothetical protein
LVRAASFSLRWLPSQPLPWWFFFLLSASTPLNPKPYIDGLLMQPSLSFSSSQGLRLVARLPHMPQSASSLSVSHPSTRQQG